MKAITTHAPVCLHAGQAARTAAAIRKRSARYWRQIRPGLAGAMTLIVISGLLAWATWSIIDVPVRFALEVDPASRHLVPVLTTGPVIPFIGWFVLKLFSLAFAFLGLSIAYGYFIYQPFFYERDMQRNRTRMEFWAFLRGYREDWE